jgi:glycosyltransferase involved in cell wall biosynthesis
MKILLLQDVDWTKKGPHQQHHLMELMSLRGHDILVIGFDQLWKEEKGFFSKRSYFPKVSRFYEGSKISFIRPAFIRFPILNYLSFAISSKIEITRQFLKFNPDLIIGFSSILTNYWGLGMAKKLGLPYLYYCDDNPSSFNVSKPLVSIAERIAIEIMKESDKVLTINRALNDYVIGLGADPFTTEVLPQGVDFRRFKPSQVDSNEVRKEYNISKDDILLFFMGWLYTFSGMSEVILDINKHKELHPKFKLMIVGYGDDYARLKILVDSLNIKDRVIMTGKKPFDEIPKLISAADFCLLPAHNDEVIRDIVPIKIYEYLAMHKPVISTKLPGMTKEFGQNDGIIFIDSPDEVIETVVSLGNEEIESIKLDAMKYIQNYDFNKILIQFESILMKLISEKK